MEVSLKDFVTTGEFGKVTLGLTRSKVKAILGEPDKMGITSRKYPTPSLWVYGDFEFSFQDEKDGGKLFYISLPSFEKTPHISNDIILDTWIFGKDLTVDKAIKHLKENNISFELTEQPSDFFVSDDNDSVVKIQSQAGVDVYFLNTILFSLGLYDRTPEKPKKQISVTLSLEAYEKIRQESQRTKMPIAKLCSDYLQNYAKILENRD
jgi:hypothetical protein